MQSINISHRKGIAQVLLIVVILVCTLVAFGAIQLFLALDNPFNKVSERTSSAIQNMKYVNSEYGFSLTFPNDWFPVQENLTDGRVGEPEVIKVIKLSGKNIEASEIKIGVVLLKDKDRYTKREMARLYKDFLGQNDRYAFFYDAQILYMYPYGCRHVENPEGQKICDGNKIIYEKTKAGVESFVPINLLPTDQPAQKTQLPSGLPSASNSGENDYTTPVLNTELTTANYVTISQTSLKIRIPTSILKI
jgi:hypothetical protein